MTVVPSSGDEYGLNKARAEYPFVIVVGAEEMESLNGFARGAQAVAVPLVCNIIFKEVPLQVDAGALRALRWRLRETQFFRNDGPARAQPGMGLQTAMRLSGLAGDHGDPGTETPANGPKSPYRGDSGATVSRQVGSKRGRRGGGIPGGIQ